MNLIINYYNDKYDTKITIPQDTDGFGPLSMTSLDDEMVAQDLLTVLQKKAAGKREYREALIMGVASGHSVPVVYMKKGDNEAFLIADSIANSSEEASSLQRYTQVPVYNIEDGRQRDAFSCFSDSLIIARDATAHAPSGEYRVPDLLEKLQSRSDSTTEEYRSTLLPNELIKPAQRKDFIDIHRENDQRKITKTMSLEEFLEKYTEEDVGTKRAISGYLRQKGLKSAEMIEMQFYIEQIEKQIQTKLPAEIKDDFAKAARAIYDTNISSNAKQQQIFNLAINICKNARLENTSSEDRSADNRSKKVLTIKRPGL